jgi:methylated-DNA-[protein]-cysteine S-methyltransferase
MTTGSDPLAAVFNHAGLDAGAAAAAAARFAARADTEGLIDVAYTTVDSPLGPLLAAATPRGLVRIAYDHNDADAVLDSLAARISPRIIESPARLDELRRELEQYFEGDRRRFEVAVDWELVHGFTRRVLEATAGIAYGDLRSYREVATVAGNEKAVRAAGNALGHNPIPIVVPCHRVVRTGGALGGYTGGLDKKKSLLTIEGSLKPD